jgi:hypothetical protein
MAATVPPSGDVEDRRDPDPAPPARILQRHQLCRPRLNWADRALLAALVSVIPRARRQRLRLLVTPDTILRWHRDIVRRRWAALSRRGKTGQPATRQNIRALVLRLVARTPDGGYRRIHGELACLGVKVAASTVWGDPEEGRNRPRAAANRASLAPVPALAGRGDPGERLLHRRPAQRHPGLRPGRDRARQQAHPHPRSYPASDRRMDCPAGPQRSVMPLQDRLGTTAGLGRSTRLLRCRKWMGTDTATACSPGHRRLSLVTCLVLRVGLCPDRCARVRSGGGMPRSAQRSFRRACSGALRPGRR